MSSIDGNLIGALALSYNLAAEDSRRLAEHLKPAIEEWVTELKKADIPAALRAEFEAIMADPPIYAERGDAKWRVSPIEFYAENWAKFSQAGLFFLEDLEVVDKYLIAATRTYCSKKKITASDHLPPRRAPFYTPASLDAPKGSAEYRLARLRQLGRERRRRMANPRTP